MASPLRAHLSFIVESRAGDVLQNAAVFVCLPGTALTTRTPPVGPMYDDPIAGNVLTNPIITNELGEADAWSDTPQSVDLLVTDNGGAAFEPSTPADLQGFEDKVKPWRGFFPVPENVGGGGGGGLPVSGAVFPEQVWGLSDDPGINGTVSGGLHTHGTPIGWQMVTFVMGITGLTHYAIRPDTGEIAHSGPSFGTVLNNTLNDVLMANGGIIAIVPGAYTVTNGVVMAGNGKFLVGLGSMKEGTSTGVRLTAAAGLGGVPVVTVNDIGSGVQGLQVDAGAIGTSAVSLGASAAGCTIARDYLLGGTQNTLKFQTGASRCNLFELRIDGNSTPSDAVVGQIGADHMFGNCRIVGPKAGAYTLHILGSFCQWSNCHITGNAACQETVLLEAAIRNIFSNCEFDTGPSGTGLPNALVHILTGSDNQFNGCKFYNSNSVTCSAVCLQKQGAGDSVKRNVFSGCTFEGAGGNFQFMFRFLNELNAVPTTLDSFAGTQLVNCSATGVWAFSNYGPIVNNVDQVVMRDLAITGGNALNISAATAAATVGTITTTVNHGIKAGMYVTLNAPPGGGTGTWPAGYTGTWKVLSDGATQFTVQLATTPANAVIDVTHYPTVSPAAQMSNGNGVAHVSGDGVATDFDVPHALGMIPEMVVASAASVDADSGRWRYSKANSTPKTLRLHCSTAPPNGPGQNVDVGWVASGVS